MTGRHKGRRGSQTGESGVGGGQRQAPRGSSWESDEQRMTVLMEGDRDAPSQKPGALETLWEMRTTPTVKG